MSEVRKPLRLLLVEDSENDAILLLRELRRGGYDPLHERVDTPEDMKAALANADERGEPWEIVISDYYMPRFRAPAALDLLRSLGYDIPFIVVSGKVGEDLAVAMMRAGAHDYITKENMARLNPAVERELREAKVRRERRQAREALGRSENRFRRLVEQAADAMFVLDLDGNFLDVNQQACSSLGYTRGELLEMGTPDIEVGHHPGALNKLWEEVSTGSPRTFEGLHRRKDGATFPVEVRVGVFENREKPLMLASARDITERKRAEAGLKESEERFRATFEQAAVGIVQVTLDAGWVRVNDRFCEIVGYTREELEEISVFDLISDEDYEADYDRGVRMLAGELREYNEEKCIVGKGERLVWINLTVSLVQDASGEPRYFMAVVEDISQRKKIEEDLRLRDRAITASSNGIIISDPSQPDNPIIYVNPSFESITGYTAREVVGRNCRFLQGDDRDQPVLDELREAIWNERNCTVQLRNYRKDGILFWNELSISPVRDEEGRLTHFIGVQNDITERRRAENAVRESEERFRALVRNASDIVVVLDAEGEIVYESPTIERILGYKPEERIGKRALDLLHPDDVERVSTELAGLLKNPEYRPLVEYRASAKDGTWHYFEAIGSNLLDDPSVGGIVVNSRDVTERKRDQAELEQQAELIDLSHDAIIVRDTQGVISYWNRGAEEIYGWTKEEVEGKIVHELLQTRFPFSRKDVEDTLQLGGRWEGELAHTRRDERRIDVESRQVVVEEEGNRTVLEINRDITQRKQSERELVRLASFPQKNPNPVIETTPTGEISYLNPTAGAWFPELAEQGSSHPLLADLEAVDAELQASEGKTFTREVRVQDKFYLQFIARLPESGLLRIYAADITERQRAEKALRQSEELYRTVVEQAAENIFLVDVETKRILECNDAFRSSLGYTEEEVGRLKLYDLVAVDRESIDQNIQRIVEQRRYSVGERQYLRKDGSLVDVEVNVSLVSLDGRDVMCVVAHDITERKRAEEALEEVREAERNRIARDLHDDILQDIVYALQETQILRAISEDGGHGELEDIAEALRNSVEGLRGAIFELRLEDTLRRSFVASLRSLIGLNRRMSRGRYELELHLNDGFPEDVSGSKWREVVRIIQEGLNNARRHAEPEHVRVSVGLEEDVAWVEVADDGRGFDPADATEGMGQSSMRQRAEELGGELYVKSVPGAGTRIRFEAPYSRMIDE